MRTTSSPQALCKLTALLGMTSIGVGSIVDYHGVDSDWISQGRGLIDDRGVGVDSTSSGVGGLVYDRCVGVEL